MYEVCEKNGIRKRRGGLSLPELIVQWLMLAMLMAMLVVMLVVMPMGMLGDESEDIVVGIEFSLGDSSAERSLVVALSGVLVIQRVLTIFDMSVDSDDLVLCIAAVVLILTAQAVEGCCYVKVECESSDKSQLAQLCGR